MTPIRTTPLRLASALLLCCPALSLHAPPVLAQTAQPPDAARGGPSPAPSGASVYFVDLKDGAVIPSKATIHFGLRGMGVAPAGVQRDNAGHHHLLVDTPLPPLSEPIPNDFNHLHFGAGQTEAELSLPPGEHTLQLLLADHKHIPHSPPIASERIRVTVRDGEAPVAARGGPVRRQPSPKGAKVYIVSPGNGAYVTRTPIIRFGLINMGIAPAGIAKANTGHHHILVDTPLPSFDRPIPNDFNHLHFGAGQTEAKITLSPGPHTLQLLFADEHHVVHDPPVYSRPIRVFVTASGRPPPRVARGPRR
ncbi:DUF4399 domain-containing protein [Methylobacterium oryzisoli]|uniref:DUF4399 domain-containing protein n=1 Tax=Methylobacterium oryzisoli TaxID=3385502 RepID=UPI00389217CA